MTTLTAGVIGQCRLSLGSAPRSFSWIDRRRYLRIPEPRWMRPNANDPLREILREQDSLLREGRLVWGALVQANTLLFQPGKDDHPAEVVYSPDAADFDNNPVRLLDIARSLYSLKGTEQSDPELMAFSEHLANEMERGMRMPLPHKLTAGATVYNTAVLISRRHLPDGVLHSSVFPLIIHPEKTAMTMMLPSRYWPTAPGAVS
ncbi:hypothetical protein [Streptomyces lushanensis]|uniref:hypothetical protein n=1 Tax=Streptomyces lushanensis TaxID=1434255 RepID=UPI001B80BA74|nr:hypothetical protein [Streptomyces lushanensis]